ncbi:MAG: hypothetical protein GC162_02620 [Planctomycetes bacterium]|nr:hypothetical protein [Planctomycetota bacterium]
MKTYDLGYILMIAVCGFTATFLMVVYASDHVRRMLRRQERRLDMVLNQQLLLNIPPRIALGAIFAGVLLIGLIAAALGGSFFFFIIGAIPAMILPYVVINHLEEKRRKRLNEQIVDGLTTLTSGVRAGLNLVQSYQLLVRNATGPIKQEFEQLMREYELGIDLNTAMHNTSDRIGSSYYRLMFAAIQAHRDRGGDMGQSLDRIGDSIREIQRLEGRLESLTAQGRAQARMMAAMPIVIVFILWGMFPADMAKMVSDPIGRLIMLFAGGLIALGFVWIRRIMAVDI